MTALSRAASGERLPSSAVVRAYAKACGADPDVWERRWRDVTEGATPYRAEEGDSPYQGLARFEQGDRALFFGRDRLVDELLKLVVDHRFAVLLGTSGSGKSSLLRAGLLPRLEALVREKDCGMELRLITPGARPNTTHGRLLDPAADGPERFVVVDQLEEIFTLCRDRADRWRFVERLLAARESSSRLRVVVAVGGSFHRLCAEHEGLAAALGDSALTVRPMSRRELQDAVVRPATAAGLRVERELTARIVEEAADQPGALPMLSQALRETWRRRRSGVLTLAAYEAAGGIHGAIAAAAEEAYRRLSPAQAATARRLLLALIAPGEGTPDARRPVSRADLREWPDPEVPGVLERLSCARLITLDEENAELAHEALITGWPRLEGWIEANRERLRQHRRLSEAARIWQEHGHDSGNLYRGAHLAVADALFGRGVSDDDLTGRERAFLSASRVADTMERWTAGRMRKRTRRLAVALCLATAGALITGQLACQKNEAADLARTRAVALEAAGLAGRTQPTDPRTAALLSVAAWRLAPSATSRAALFTALTEPQEDVFTRPEQGEDGRSFLTDSGRTLLAVGEGAWSTWDVATHRRTGAGAMPDEPVVDVDSGGGTLALGGRGGRRLWRLPGADGAQDAGAYPAAAGRVLGFGGDGHSYVVQRSGPDPRVQLRSVEGGRVLFETVGDLYPVPSSDDRLVALCRRGRPVEVWDVVRRRALRGDWRDSAVSGDCSSSTVAFGAGGARLAVVSGGGIRVWDTGSGRRLADLGGPGARHLAFTPDGEFLAAGGADGVRVWRVSAPRVPVLNQTVAGAPVSSLAWDPARPTLRYLAGGTVRSLDLSGSLVSTWRERPLAAVLLSPDGRLLAVGERTGTGYRVRLQDLRTGRRVAQLSVAGRKSDDVGDRRDGRGADRPLGPTEMSDTASDSRLLLAFSPDSRYIAYGVAAPSAGGPSAGGLADGPSAGRFVVRDVSARGPEGASLEVVGPVGATARSIGLTARGRRLLVSWALPGGGFAGQVWDTVRRSRIARPEVLASAASATLASGYSGRSSAPGLGPFREADGTYDLAVSADGAHLASGGASGTVTVWDAAGERRTEAVVPPFPATTSCASCSRITALAFSPDGRTLAVAYGSGGLRLWDLALNQPLGGSLGDPGDAVDSLAFGAEGAFLYAAGRHIPVHTYAVGATQVAARLCARARRTLSMGEWHRYLPDVPYRKVCEQPEEGHDDGATATGDGLVTSTAPKAATDAGPDARTDAAAETAPVSTTRTPTATAKPSKPVTPATPESERGPNPSPSPDPRPRPGSVAGGRKHALDVPPAKRNSPEPRHATADRARR
ncbi:nSTAND1 domain-containing NTPase [Streptomyces sp. NPDC001617]